MKCPKLRKQIADCVRFIRRNSDWCPERGVSKEVLDTINTASLLSDIVSAVGDVPFDSIVVDSESSTDYDGYPENYIILSIIRKQTDEEWFDKIADCIAPNEYQQHQYQQYLYLKNLFDQTSK